MNKPLLLAATLGAALVAAMVLAAPHGANASASVDRVMVRAAAYAVAVQG